MGGGGGGGYYTPTFDIAKGGGSVGVGGGGGDGGGQARNGPNYYGREIGSFEKNSRNIKGVIYAADDTTLFIKGFFYNGTSPDTYFWVGNSTRPSPNGYIVPYPEDYKGRDPPMLTAHDNTDIVLKLPQGKRLRDIKWLSVWCRRFTGVLSWGGWLVGWWVGGWFVEWRSRGSFEASISNLGE
ncbi:hypothetical protein M0802_012193 [Mischocyttarus mexicanus]|nr:hypothetical protein M0802_012193 [Mischocyttarus mexicanus]